MSSPLFTPLRIGNLTLSHRIVMAPMTRLRATPDGVVTEVTAEYYSQRSKVPGTLIISEGTAIAAEAGGFPNLPGIYNDAQAAAWKKVVEAVHANNSSIYLQIAALGRVGSPEALHAAGHPYVSSSPTKLSSKSETPTELSISEIKRYVKMFGEAARRGVHEAGVDGIELHACHGSLVDQFIQDVVNKRTDQYGGSVENRSRFVLEVIDAIVSEIGAQRTGIRLSPWSTTQEMGMRNPIPTYSYIVSQLVQRHPELAYVHVVEPGREGTLNGLPQALDEGVTASNDFIYQLWAPRPYLTAGGYDTTSAAQAVERLENTGVVFGQLFISNPDLPARIRNGAELASSDKTTHYALGPEFTKGYIDYPSASASVPALA